MSREWLLNTDARAGVYRVLSIDGGGIRGVFPAAFLAQLQKHLEHPIGRYFDLIAGTSTGGIIAIGLGLGIPISEILQLYELKGPRIFDQHRGHVVNWLRQRVRSAKRLMGAKYASHELRSALEEVLKERRLARARPGS
jgi:patatin-like phospholipase/acyl hydrolase